MPLNHYWKQSTTPVGAGEKEIMKWLRSQGLGMFRPLRRYYQWIGDHTEADGVRESRVHVDQWLFSCTKLLANGRCGIYAQRPELCKSYAPGNDMLCVHVQGRDGKPIIPQKPIRASQR